MDFTIAFGFIDMVRLESSYKEALHRRPYEYGRKYSLRCQSKSRCLSDLQVGYLGWLIDFSNVGVSLVASAFSIFLFQSSGL